VIKEIAAVVESRDVFQFLQVLCPHDVCIPSLKLQSPFFSTTFFLKFLGSFYAVLIIENYKIALLDFFPFLRLVAKQVFVFID